MRKLLIATTNPGKVTEVISALDGADFEIVSLKDFPNLPDVEETGTTFKENAIIKAKAYSEYTSLLTLADDSGLEVDFLDGAPGVYSSRFAENDIERNKKLLGMLENVEDEDRTARFRCVIAISDNNGNVYTCEGIVEGVIQREMRGTNGFGYDPVFYIPSAGKTMAELTPQEKNNISHRGKALKKAIEILKEI
ncbi:MAG: XTP/dITP diphosphatase [Armatimonadota bacterium]